MASSGQPQRRTAADRGGLTVADATVVARILGESAQLAPDVMAQRRCIGSGMAKLISAEFWLYTQAYTNADASDAMGISAVDGGWTSDRQRTRYFEMLCSPLWQAFIGPRVAAGWEKQPHVTLRRQDYLRSPAAWHGSELYRQWFVPIGLDEFMISCYRITPQVHAGVGFYRKRGGKPFTAYDSALVHLVVSELHAVHAFGADAPAAAKVGELTPRQRAITVLMWSGDDRAAIARKLGISAHTVNDHVKEIYRILGVSSRAELMAAFRPAHRA